MKIKKIFLSCLALTLIFSFIACESGEISSSDKELVIGYIDYPWYDSLQELYAAADFVVKAKVLESRAEWMSHLVDPTQNNNPEADPGGEVNGQKVLTTIYELEIDTAYKGRAGDRIELFQLGGETDTVIYEYEGSPEISINQTYLLFLSQSGSSENASWLLNHEQAIYKVEGNELIRLSSDTWELTFEDLPR